MCVLASTARVLCDAQSYGCVYKARLIYDPNIAELEKVVTRIGDDWPLVCTALGLRQHCTARFTSTDTIGRSVTLPGTAARYL